MIEQIAFDNISIRTDSGKTMTSHSVASDATLVIAGIRPNQNPSSVSATFGGVAMTNIQKATTQDLTTAMVMFYLQNPPTGAQTFDTDLSGITSGECFVASFKKSAYVDLTNQQWSNAVATNSVSQSLSNLCRTGWIFAWEWNNNTSNSCSFGSGTQRLLSQVTRTHLMQTLEVSQPTSTTMTATISSSGTGDHMIILAEIHPKNSKGLTFLI